MRRPRYPTGGAAAPLRPPTWASPSDRLPREPEGHREANAANRLRPQSPLFLNSGSFLRSPVQSGLPETEPPLPTKRPTEHRGRHAPRLFLRVMSDVQADAQPSNRPCIQALRVESGNGLQVVAHSALNE